MAAVSAHEIETVLDFVQHRGNIGRIVLPVAIEECNAVTSGGHDPGIHRSALARVFGELDDSDVIAGGDSGECFVRAFIVHEDDFVRTARHGSANLLRQRRDVVLFVKEWDDDGNHWDRVSDAGGEVVWANVLCA